jgi:hypothetical protein
VPRFRPDNADTDLLSDFLLTTLIRERAGRFAGRLARRLALTATRLFLLIFKAALHNCFDMLHSDLLIRMYYLPLGRIRQSGFVTIKAINRLYNRCGSFCNTNYTQAPPVSFAQSL